jgi:hypothetical protein
MNTKNLPNLTCDVNPSAATGKEQNIQYNNLFENLYAMPITANGRRAVSPLTTDKLVNKLTYLERQRFRNHIII